MKNPTSSKARRILGPMDNFQHYDENCVAAAQLISRLHLMEGEVPIGIYAPPSEEHESVVVTNRGLYIVMGEATNFVAYSAIDRIDTPGNKQERELTLHLADGESVLLPTRGGKGRFRDTFEFLRFLMRVTEQKEIDKCP